MSGTIRERLRTEELTNYAKFHSGMNQAKPGVITCLCSSVAERVTSNDEVQCSTHCKGINNTMHWQPPHTLGVRFTLQAFLFALLYHLFDFLLLQPVSGVQRTAVDVVLAPRQVPAWPAPACTLASGARPATRPALLVANPPRQPNSASKSARRPVQRALCETNPSYYMAHPSTPRAALETSTRRRPRWRRKSGPAIGEDRSACGTEVAGAGKGGRGRTACSGAAVPESSLTSPS